MKARWMWTWAAAVAAVGLMAAEARAVLTMEQALEISEKTGRLLFAVAGDKQ
jgi:hypothetical protein